MRLATVWLVRDPSPGATLPDIVWRQSVERLPLYIRGSGPGTWERERTALYTTEADAMADAEARLAVYRS